MPHDVFISYATDDKSIADAACATLESRGVRCWIAPRDILPGSSWGESIISAIEDARVFILVFSSHANASQQVMREVERAVNKGLIVVPVRIEDAKPSKAMEYFISAPHWLDAITPPLQHHLDLLANKVLVILGAPVPKSPSAPKPTRSIATKTKHLVLAGVVGLVVVVTVGWALGQLFSNGGAAAKSTANAVAQPTFAAGDIWSGTASLPRSRRRSAVVMKVTKCDPDGAFLGGLFLLARSNRPSPLSGRITGSSLTFKCKRRTYTGEIVDGQIRARWQEGRWSGDMRLSPNHGSAKAMKAGSAWVGTLHGPSGVRENLFLRVNQRTDEGELSGLACLPFRHGQSDVVTGLVVADRVLFRVLNRRFSGVVTGNVLEGEAGIRREDRFRLELRNEPAHTFAVGQAWTGSGKWENGQEERARLLVTRVSDDGSVGLEVSCERSRPGIWGVSGCVFADTLVFHGAQLMAGTAVCRQDRLTVRLSLARETAEFVFTLEK